MNIYLYQNHSPNDHLDKSLSGEHMISGTVKQGSSYGKVDCTFVVNGDIGDYNYCKIGNRYYYIVEVTRNITGLTELRMHEDVLMTYRGTIRGCTAHITRSAAGNSFLPDPQFSAFGNKKIGIYKFSGSFNQNGQYVLVTAGG
jgi:hypothetical protein